MKILIAFAVIGLAWLVSRRRARSRAIATLNGITEKFDHSKHREGCIDASYHVEEGLALCRKYGLKGPEFGFASLADFCMMGIDSTKDAIWYDIRKKHASMRPELELGLKKLQDMHRELSQPVDKKIQPGTVVPAHA